MVSKKRKGKRKRFQHSEETKQILRDKYWERVKAKKVKEEKELLDIEEAKKQIIRERRRPPDMRDDICNFYGFFTKQNDTK